MKLSFITLLITLLVLPMSLFANEDLITLKSSYSVNETADRFENIIAEKGLKFFTRINHSENASKVELELRPTQVILFGNPNAGTPLMLCAQSVAIDLPQKALFWEDEAGASWLSYNNPMYLKKRHNIEGCDTVLDKITNLLAVLAESATSKE